MILDCVGGSHVEKNLAAVATDGQWVLYGTMGGADVEGPFLRGLLKKRISLMATTLRTRSDEVGITFSSTTVCITPLLTHHLSTFMSTFMLTS